jgi:hypothetical protein
VGLTNPFIVTPGNKEASVLWERLRLLNDDRMPPLGSELPHSTAIDVIGEWIDAGAN